MSDGPFFRTLFLEDEKASLKFAETLSVILKPADVILLSGDLGAGKTTLARGLIRSFLNDPHAEVPSPTFNIVIPYFSARFPIHHFDLYRIFDAEELEETGFYEVLEDGAALVEWPERVDYIFDDKALKIILESERGGRIAHLYGLPDWQARLGRSFAIRDFLDGAGWHEATRQFLQGDASIRAYEIVERTDGKRAVLMNWPKGAEGPAIKEGKTYSDLAHLATNVRPFVAIGQYLNEEGLCAPSIFAQDLDEGLLLLEHLGSETIAPEGEPILERYEGAIDVLVTLHQLEVPRSIGLSDGKNHFIPEFNQEIWEIETALLFDWYVPKMTDLELQEGTKADYREIWAHLFKTLQTAERGLILRDYHSPNLIWREEHEGLNRIGLIDFQDALIGPSAYDVASLCQDARVTISEEMEARLKAHYCAARKAKDDGFEPLFFEQAYAIIAAERATRLLGLWPRLKFRDHKPHYLKHMPRTRDYLTRVLSHPVLSDLKDWYKTHLCLYKEG